MIDVIIPAYNAHNTIFQLLCSIGYQTIVDKVNVTIVNDNSSSDYSSFVDFFKNYFNISELKNDVNCGPGVSRQIGIDSTNNPYIMFIDSDDCLSDCLSLEKLLCNIENSDYNVVGGKVVIQNECGFDVNDEESVRLHGKMYRRKFLKDYNISFGDFRYDEDNYFNSQIFLTGNDVYYLDSCVYIWRNIYSTSLSHSEYYSNNPLNSYVRSIIYAIEYGKDNNCNCVRIADLTVSAFTYIYYFYLLYDINFDDIIIDLKALAKYYNFYKNFLVKSDFINIVKKEFDVLHVRENSKILCVQRIKFSDFIDMILNY